MHKFGLRDTAYMGRVAAGASPYLIQPSDIAGLQRWYAADSFDDLGYSNNDTITDDWPDLTLTADAVPRASPNDPKFRNDQLASLNGSSIYFTNNNGRFLWAPSLTLGDFTFIAIWKPASDSYLTSDNGVNMQIREAVGGGSEKPQIYPNAPPALQYIGANPTNIWHMRSWTRTKSTGVPLFYYNKAQQAEDTGDTNATDFTCSEIGAAATFMFMHLAEMCVYNTVLTQTNIDDLYDGYFAIKYVDDL